MAYPQKQQQQQFPQRKKGPLDNDKLTMWANSTQAGKKARLTWTMFKNNPRVVVYTGDENDKTKDKNYGRIEAAMGCIEFESLLSLLEKAATSKEEVKFKIENRNYTFFGGKRSDAPALISETWLGRDKDGIIWMSVVANNRPKIKFQFTFSEYHSLYHGDGTQFTHSETSSMVALSTVKVLRDLYHHMLVTEYVDPQADKPAYNGGGQGGGQSSGGYNKPAAQPQAEEDFADMPF